MSKPKKVKETCRKCGHLPHTQWHQEATTNDSYMEAWLRTQECRQHTPGVEFIGNALTHIPEHLHHKCANCGWVWVTLPLDVEQAHAH